MEMYWRAEIWEGRFGDGINLRKYKYSEFIHFHIIMFKSDNCQ